MLLLTKKNIELLFLYLMCFAIFMWGIAGQEVIGFDSRFYLFSLEMWRNGPSLFPTTYLKPYPDYPATSTLIVYLFACIFGTLNKVVAVFPYAMIASITGVFVYLIGRLQNKKLGIYAVLFLLMTLTFLKSGRSLTLDLYLTCITTICFYVIHIAESAPSLRKTFLLYFLLIVGFAVRGPMGLIMPAGVVVSYYLSTCQIKKMITVGFGMTLLLILCCGALFSLAYWSGGLSFTKHVMQMQVTSRVTSDYFPYYFYLQNGLFNYAVSFPIALLVIVGVGYYRLFLPNYFSNRILLKTLISWFLIILIAMSIPGEKKVRYILPLIPAAALLTGFLFTELTEKYFSCLKKIIVFFLTFLPCILSVCFYFLSRDCIVSYPVWMDFFFLWMQVCIMFFNTKYLRQADLLIVLIATITFVVSYIKIIEPLEISYEKARDFINSVESKRLHQNLKLVFYKEKIDGLPIKYLINMSKQEWPDFISTENELSAYSSHAFIITDPQNFKYLNKNIQKQFMVITQGKIGHNKVVVFSRKT